MPGEADDDLQQQADSGTYTRYALTKGLKVTTAGANSYPLDRLSQTLHLRNTRAMAFYGLGLATNMNLTATAPKIKAAIPKKWVQATQHSKKVRLTEDAFE